jgi:hypothetical protein
MRLSAGNYRHGEARSITANLLEEKNQQESQKRGARRAFERAGSDSNERRDVPSIARMIRLRLREKICKSSRHFPSVHSIRCCMNSKLIFVLLMLSISCSFVSAQDLGGLGGEGDAREKQRQMDWGFGMFLIQLALDKKVAEDLEIVASQRTELAEYAKKSQETFEDFRRREESILPFGSVIPHDLSKKISDANVVSQNAIVDFLEEKLLSHQVVRLKQLAIWTYINKAERFSAVFEMKLVKEELELNEGDVEKLSAAEKDLQEEFESDLEKLRRKYRGKLIDSLDSSKKEKFKRLLGDPDLIGANKVKF